jgi:hypothetical protein
MIIAYPWTKLSRLAAVVTMVFNFTLELSGSTLEWGAF